MKTWSSQKYKRAAEMHKKSCDFMLTNITNIKQTDRPSVYCEIYYISGYVLECILKYFILESKHKKGNVTKDELENLGLWTHDISKLLKIAIDTGGIKSTEKPPFNRLTFEWNSEIRYETDTVDYRDSNLVTKNYNESIIKFYEIIKNKY